MVRVVAGAALGWAMVAGCGAGNDGGGGSRPGQADGSAGGRAGAGGSGGGVGGGSGGRGAADAGRDAPGTCAPGATEACYTGPAGTQGVGLCRPGMRVCNSSGSGFGSCEGEVVPAAETCATADDEDCDGKANEEGAACVCVPGTTSPCYAGPAGTAGVGQCRSGMQTCEPSGARHGSCAGEVLPKTEDCTTPTDDDCDGQAPPCTIIDIRADVNRNGTVDLMDPTEDEGEESFTATRGAVFLPNIDDDRDTCPASGVPESQLVACHDAADTEVNGPDDLLDLARIKTVPWPNAPDDARGTITISMAAASRVRLFRATAAGAFALFNPAAATLTAADLRTGVEFGIEGRDILRDSAVWDGTVDVTLNVDAGTGPAGPLTDGTDKVRLRLAPLLFRHHLDPARTVYVAKLPASAPGGTAFRADLAAATSAAGISTPVVDHPTDDRWTQDYFETAYLAMPGPGGRPHVIHVNIRSANNTVDRPLRPAGRLVYALRGKDAGAVAQWEQGHSDNMDTLNSFGNLETIPPHTAPDGKRYPMGRVVRGATTRYYPDRTFDRMVAAQAVQAPIAIDTSWLLVAHVDETISFVKSSSPRGFAVLVADPTMARKMLTDQRTAGNGTVRMFAGKSLPGVGSASRTITAVLDDPDLMSESNMAVAAIDQQASVLRTQVGLTDADFIPVPFLFEPVNGLGLAYQPGTVNGIYLSDRDFGAPVPWGPVIGGVDIFRRQLEQALSPLGITVRWIENWDLLHVNYGEVHCGSNVTRDVPADARWWEGGL